jgi:hypothetical protein
VLRALWSTHVNHGATRVDIPPAVPANIARSFKRSGSL